MNDKGCLENIEVKKVHRINMLETLLENKWHKIK